MRTFTAHTAKDHSNTDTKGKRELSVAIEKKNKLGCKFIIFFEWVKF